MATTETQLAEARQALHKLLTGRSVVSVQIDGVTTQYSQANLPALRSYIESLEFDLGIKSARRVRPAGVY